MNRNRFRMRLLKIQIYVLDLLIVVRFLPNILRDWFRR
jgi:hypothetical protein